MHMQAVQTLAVDVSAKWRKGVDVATKRKAALQDALTFHINLFEVCSQIVHIYLHIYIYICIHCMVLDFAVLKLNGSWISVFLHMLTSHALNLVHAPVFKNTCCRKAAK